VENQTNHNKAAQQAGEQVDTAPAVRIVPDDLLEVLWRNRWLVALTPGGDGGGPDLCTAARLCTPARRSSTSSRTARDSHRNRRLTTPTKNCLYTQAALLTSTPVLTAAVEKPGVGQLRVLAGVSKSDCLAKGQGAASLGRQDGRHRERLFRFSRSAEAACSSMRGGSVQRLQTASRRHRRRNLNILQNEKRQQDAELVEAQAMLDFKTRTSAWLSRIETATLLDKWRACPEMTAAQLEVLGPGSPWKHQGHDGRSDLAAALRGWAANGDDAPPAESEWLRLENELEQLEVQLSDHRQSAKRMRRRSRSSAEGQSGAEQTSTALHEIRPNTVSPRTTTLRSRQAEGRASHRYYERSDKKP